MIQNFYDELAPYYRYVYSDWEASSRRQAEALDAIIRNRWPGARAIMDLACGIGTQAIGLAQRGYHVTASSLAAEEVRFARMNASACNVEIRCHVADMRAPAARGPFDVVLACDNAIPHLASVDEIEAVFRAAAALLRPGGGCLFSVRDYDAMPLPRHGTHINPRQVHETRAGRITLLDVWDLDGDYYDVTTYIIVDPGNAAPTTHVARGGRYFRVSLPRLAEALARAGFAAVEVIRDSYFQPVLVGTR